MRLLVLSYLVERASVNDSEALQTGLRQDQLATLRSMATRDLALLARMREPHLRLELDEPELDHGLRALRSVRERERQIDYFVRHSATVSLLVALFRLSPAEVAQHRAALGLTGSGRPRMPEPKRREAICEEWHRIRAEDGTARPTADQYERLHRAFQDLSLATLYGVINEFED